MNSGKNGGEFGGFLLKAADSSRWQQSVLLRKLKPQERFVGFLQCAPDFVDPIGFTAGATSSTIAGGHAVADRRTWLATTFPFTLRGKASVIFITLRANFLVRALSSSRFMRANVGVSAFC